MKIYFSLVGYYVLLLRSLRLANKDKEKINSTLDGWHKAAAEAKYNDYFNFMTEDAVFIGNHVLSEN
jgi:ketosteroid isomerase-like protein